jgi:YidC/Oxa1 family membrane protein insertase
MKFQDILSLLLFSTLLMLGIQYFFVGRNLQENAAIRSGQSFQAPLNPEVFKPLITEINFSNHLPEQALETLVITPHAEFTFSTHGACLQRMLFKHGKNEELLSTIDMPIDHRKDDSPFLIAFDNDTPYYYRLMSHRQELTHDSITYQVDTQMVRVTKQYVVYRDICKIDLHVTLEPLTDNGVIQPRIVFPSPWISELGEKNGTMGLVYNEYGKLKKNLPQTVKNQFWAHPTLFGLENRYFIHALISDSQNFIQRAYYRVSSKNRADAVLEGPLVKAKANWMLSFYCGPKEQGKLTAVDDRLEKAFDYGFFAIIAKLLLSLLKFFYSYLHNYGWAIIALTIFLKIILLPLTVRGERNEKKNIELQKKMHYLEQKYKNDRETLAQEKLELMRKSGMGMLGMFVPFLQVPILIGMNRVLTGAIELYHAPFIGWITDLSRPDAFYILPALTGIGVVMQMRAAQFDIRKGLVSTIVALALAGAFSYFSAGLSLYFFVSTFLGLLQTAILKKLKK